MYSAAVVTVSDRASAGVYADGTGPVVAELLRDAGYEVKETVVIPDDQAGIEAELIRLSDAGIDLIVTNGGTGFSPRDVTPDATMNVCDRLTPGIPEAMRAASMRVTPRAMLSRAAAGIRKNSLIVNLPGSPKGAKENLQSVITTLGHGLAMLAGEGH